MTNNTEVTVTQAAELAAMYLDTGFIECPQCGHEVKTDTTDAFYTLRDALAQHRTRSTVGEATKDDLKPFITEMLSHRGENPYMVKRGGYELWEAYVPSVQAALPYLPDASPKPNDSVDAVREEMNWSEAVDFAERYDLPIAALQTQPAAQDVVERERDIEIKPLLKGMRRSPKYYPSIGETCRMSGPNCDDANGYTWSEVEILWTDGFFIVTRFKDCWPTVTKLELALFEALSKPAGEGS